MSIFFGRLAILGWIFTVLLILTVLVILAVRRGRTSASRRGFEVEVGRSDEEQS